MNAIKNNPAWAIVFLPPDQYLVCSSTGANGDWATTGDNTVVTTINLANYDSGIQFGHGAASYVYLRNQLQNSLYAVGTLSSGAMKILTWTGATWR